MRESWVFKSNLFSVKNNKTSILAILETVIAISLAFFIWKYSDSFFYIYMGLFISPFLLLRTKKSTEEGLNLFNKLHRFIDFKYNRILSYCFIIIFYSLIGYFIFTLQYLIIYFIFILCCILAIELTHNNINKNIFYRIASIVELIPSILIPISMLILLSIGVKVFSTIKNFSFESIKSIPINWKRIVFETDIFYPPELLPGIEECNYENLTSFKSSNIAIVLKLDASIPYKIFVVFNYLLFLIPTVTYRYSLKATALIYIPLIWLLPRDNILSKQYMKKNSKTLISSIMFLYSLFVIIGLTITPLYLHSQITNSVEYLPNFIDYEIYKIFFAIEFNLWYITRFIASSITIYIFIKFQNILIEENNINNYSKYNWLIILDTLRRMLTIFTLICTLYLFYINTSIPIDYINNLLENIKFLPW